MQNISFIQTELIALLLTGIWRFYMYLFIAK